VSDQSATDWDLASEYLSLLLALRRHSSAQFNVRFRALFGNQRVARLRRQMTQVRHRTNSWALGAGAQTAVYARLGFVTITSPKARYDFLASRLVVGMSVALIYD
jgi:hypothetical protein